MTKALQPDDLIAHYHVLRALGAGGMGEVYLARDSTLDRHVALKVLPQMAQDDDRVKRFILEAKSASSLNHPHIITVYEIGCQPVISGGTARPEKVHYIAMELVDGDALADIIHDSKADLKSLLGYLAQAADGLAKAHASGIVHRDLKPGNIMVSKDGYAKVLDFGLAKLVEKEAAPDATLNVVTKQALTMEGMIVGTIGYMAPEQILGRPVDHRSDIFSFGCILYEAVTHQRPFAADSQFEALQKIVHEHPAAIESYVADAPIELRQLIARCLAKNPDERLPSMKDVAAELRRISSSYEVLSRASAQPTDQTMFFPSASGGIPPPPGAYPPGYPQYPSNAFPPAATLPSGMAVPQGLTAPSGVAAPPGVAAPAGVAVAEKKKPIALIAGTGVLVLALAGFGVWKFALGGGAGGGSGLSEEALSAMKIAPVLSSEVLQAIAVSPEGRFAAHVSLQNGKYRLQLRQISTQTDREIVPPQELNILGLAFTPDGDRLWYCMYDKENQQYSSLYEVPSLGGGEPTRRVTDADTEPTFSPDGKSIAFVRAAPSEKKTMLMIAQEDGTGAKPLVTLPMEVDNALSKPRWSPDGKQIAVIYRPAGKPNLVVIDVASAQQQQIGTWEGPVIDSVAWLGANGFVVAGAPAPGPSQLWYVAYPGGQRRRLSNDISDYTFVSTSSDGKTIAARRNQRSSEVWEVPVAGSPAELKTVTQGKENIAVPSLTAASDGTLLYTAPQEDSMTLWAFKPGAGKRSLAPKGTTVLTHRFLRGQDATAFTAYGADFVGHIHRVNVDGSNPKQLTNGQGETLVAATPDGKFLLYNTPQAPRTLMLMAADGSGSPRPLATDYIVEGGVIFSRDGKILSYQKFDTSQQQVVTVRTFVNLDDSKTIATLPARRGDQITPDGSVSYIHVTQTAEKTPLSTVYKIPLTGGTPQKLFEVADARIDRVSWADDKTAVVGGFSTKTQTSILWRWTAGSAKLSPLTDFRAGFIFEFAPSHDGKMLYFTQGSNNRDIIKITGLVK